MITNTVETQNPVDIISLGVGLQSSTMALMAKHGEITPMPVAAVFADTQAEPQSVYRWLEKLEALLPFPVKRVTKGSLTKALTTLRHKRDGSGDWVYSGIPSYNINPDLTDGHVHRQCTHSYKIEVLDKAAREIAKIGRRQKTVGVIRWIGISLDEAHRMKPSRKPWSEHRWPLIEKRMTRHDCERWLVSNGYPIPSRSACVYCPYRSDADWRRLRDEEPLDFAKAVRVDKEYRKLKALAGRGGIPFVHASRVPLDEVDFSTDEERGQVSLFGNECEGMCGV